MSSRKAAWVTAALILDQNIPAAAVRVYAVLALHENRDSGDARVWASSIGEKLDMTRQAVSQHVATLEAAGYLRVVREEGRANRYILTPPESTKDEPGTEVESRPNVAPHPQAVLAPTRKPDLRPPQVPLSPHPQAVLAQKNQGEMNQGKEPSRPVGRRGDGLGLPEQKNDPVAELTDILWRTLVRHPHSRRKDYLPLVRAALQAGHSREDMIAGAEATTSDFRRRHMEGGPSLIQDYAERGEKWIAGEGWVSALEAKAERERAKGGDRRLTAEEVEATRRQLADAAARQEAEEQALVDGKVVRLPSRPEPIKAGGAA